MLPAFRALRLYNQVQSVAPLDSISGLAGSKYAAVTALQQLSVRLFASKGSPIEYSKLTVGKSSIGFAITSHTLVLA